MGLRLDTYYDNTQAEISQGIASLKFNNPSFLETSYIHSQDLRFQKLNLDTFEFDIDRIGLETLFQETPSNKFSHSFGHSIFHETLDNVSNDAILGDLDSGSNVLSLLFGRFTYDLRDNPLNPHAGLASFFDVNLANELLGSDADYLLTSFRQVGILPLASTKFDLANNFRVASAWGYSETDVIPISQRFYLGGRTSVRGFRENSLGPKGTNGSVIGGDLLLANNLELRYETFTNLLTHVFLDTGTVYLKEKNVDFSQLRWGTGVGFRYLSPIGPVGFDLAHALDQKPGEPSFRLHFNIGSTF